MTIDGKIRHLQSTQASSSFNMSAPRLTPPPSIRPSPPISQHKKVPEAELQLETPRFLVRIRIRGTKCRLLGPNLPELRNLLAAPGMGAGRLIMELERAGKIFFSPTDGERGCAVLFLAPCSLKKNKNWRRLSGSAGIFFQSQCDVLDETSGAVFLRWLCGEIMCVTRFRPAWNGDMIVPPSCCGCTSPCLSRHDHQLTEGGQASLPPPRSNPPYFLLFLVAPFPVSTSKPPRPTKHATIFTYHRLQIDQQVSVSLPTLIRPPTTPNRETRRHCTFEGTR